MKREGSNDRTSPRAALIAAALTLLAVVISCGTFPEGNNGPRDGSGVGGGNGGSSDGGGGLDGGLTSTNACALMNTRKCDYLQRCGLIAQGEPAARDCAWAAAAMPRHSHTTQIVAPANPPGTSLPTGGRQCCAARSQEPDLPAPRARLRAGPRQMRFGVRRG